MGLLALSYVPQAHAGGASFDLQADALMPVACSAANGCWTNYLRVTDLDADDDLDIVFVNYFGFFTNGMPEPLVIYDNDGGSFTDVSDRFGGGWNGRIRQVAIGDIDGDGFVDVFAPDAQGGTHALFMNDGSGSFTDEFDDRIDGGITAQAGATRMADFDGDGSLDLFIAGGYTQGPAFDPAGYILLNDGTGNFSGPGTALPGAIPGDDPDDVDIFDADRDFDLDIMVNAHVGGNGLFLNEGDGTFTDATEGLPVLGSGFHYGPGICDIDEDGDLDIWIENAGTGGLRFEILMVNDGSGVFTDVTAAQYPDNTTDDDNGVTCVDIDNDGDFDAVITALSSPERLLVNNGGTFSASPGVFPGPTDTSLWLEFGDLNGDGRFDVVTGQGEVDTENQIYFANNMVAVDDQAPVVTHNQTVEGATADDTPIVRYAVRDRFVTDEGPRVRAFARITVDEGEPEEIDALFVGGDLFSATLPTQAGGSTVSVELCATDRAGNEGCAEEFVYMVEPSGNESGTGDPTGSGSASMTGTDTADPTGDDATVTDSLPTSAGTAEGSATDSDTDGTSGEDDTSDGCGCRTTTPAPFLLLIPLLVSRRRRAAVDR